jgi:hypothetical protein
VSGYCVGVPVALATPLKSDASSSASKTWASRSCRCSPATSSGSGARPPGTLCHKIGRHTAPPRTVRHTARTRPPPRAHRRPASLPAPATPRPATPGAASNTCRNGTRHGATPTAAAASHHRRSDHRAGIAGTAEHIKGKEFDALTIAHNTTLSQHKASFVATVMYSSRAARPQIVRRSSADRPQQY